MTQPIRTHEQTTELKTIVTSVSTSGAKSPEEVIAALDKLGTLGIESFVTEQGDLWIRYWRIAAEDFISPEHAAVIRSKRSSPDQTDNLDWLSKNLIDIRRQYGGQWVAVYDNAVVATDPNLSDLMDRISEFDKPLVTFIPADPVLWTFTYAH